MLQRCSVRSKLQWHPVFEPHPVLTGLDATPLHQRRCLQQLITSVIAICSLKIMTWTICIKVFCLIGQLLILAAGSPRFISEFRLLPQDVDVAFEEERCGVMAQHPAGKQGLGWIRVPLGATASNTTKRRCSCLQRIRDFNTETVSFQKQFLHDPHQRTYVVTKRNDSKHSLLVVVCLAIHNWTRLSDKTITTKYQIGGIKSSRHISVVCLRAFFQVLSSTTV